MASQFARFKKKAMKKALFVAKATGVEMGNQITQSTPVDSGLARASWQGAIGSPKGDLTPDTGRNPSVEFEVTLRDLGVGDVAYFTNPQSYIIPLEYGWSAKSPNGMVRKTVALFPQIVRQKIKDAERVKL